MFKSKLAVVILRGQGPTHAHFHLIEEAHKTADNVLVLLGSANRSRDTRNPWTTEERETFFRAGLQDAVLFNTVFKPLNDFLYMDDEWEGEVEKIMRGVYRRCTPSKFSYNDIVLVTCRKDMETSGYIDLFDKWPKHEIEPLTLGNRQLNASDFRFSFFKHPSRSCSQFMRPEVIKAIDEWKQENPDIFAEISARYDHIARAKMPYLDLPFGIKFMTSDALVMCNGHVLLCKRRQDQYGGGQWAMPGGYIEMYEAVKDGIFRELKEETSVDVPPRALRQGFRGYRKFELAGRDERGDFTTFCGVFTLEANTNGSLPKITPQREEIDEVRWIPLAALDAYAKNMFLDHAFIVEIMRRAVAINSNVL